MDTPTAADGPTPVDTSKRSRIRGIDVARAVAIVGMVAIHIGPQDLPGGGFAGAALRSAHGRASILFVLLAGIGVSLLAGDRSPPRLRRATRRLGWRVVVLLPAGVALQALPTNVAVILQYYAVYFLVAAVAVRWSSRWLAVGAVVSATLGPVLLVWLHATAPQLFQPGVPHWTDVDRIVRDIAVTGFYPVVVWTAPLLVGMLLGRADLRAPATARWLAVGGAVTAAAGFVVSDTLVAVLGRPTSLADWRSLAVVEPHNDMTSWVLTSTAVAVAALGAALEVSRHVPRLVRPLATLGELALSVYVLHIVVLAVRPSALVETTFTAAWASLLRFTVVATVLAVAWRAVAALGPFEMLLRVPWIDRATPRATVRAGDGRS